MAAVTAEEPEHVRAAREAGLLGAPPADVQVSIDIMDFVGRPRTPDLVEGTLTRRGVAQLIGPSGSGKSFIALSLAWHIASNATSWFGRDVLQHGPVVYYPTEGFDTIGPRAAALEAAYGPLAHPLRVVERSDLFPLAGDGGAGRAALSDGLRRDLNGATPVLLIVDTQLGALAAAGVEENDNSGMHAAIDAIADLCGPDELDCLLLLAHHTGKNPALGGRGASSQFGYMDCVIELDNASPNELGKGPYYIRPTKYKPDRPWESREEYEMVKIPELDGTYARHVTTSGRGVYPSAVQKGRADIAAEHLVLGPASPAELREVVGISTKVWEKLVTCMTQDPRFVTTGSGPGVRWALADDPDHPPNGTGVVS